MGGVADHHDPPPPQGRGHRAADAERRGPRDVDLDPGARGDGVAQEGVGIRNLAGPRPRDEPAPTVRKGERFHDPAPLEMDARDRTPGCFDVGHHVPVGIVVRAHGARAIDELAPGPPGCHDHRVGAHTLTRRGDGMHARTPLAQRGDVDAVPHRRGERGEHRQRLGLRQSRHVRMPRTQSVEADLGEDAAVGPCLAAADAHGP